jgi:hypothetical protein
MVLCFWCNAPLMQHSVTIGPGHRQPHVQFSAPPPTTPACRFGPLDLLEDPSAPLLLEQQQHSLTWTSDAQAVLQQRTGDKAFAQAAEAALQAAQTVRCVSCLLVFAQHMLVCTFKRSICFSVPYRTGKPRASLALICGTVDSSNVPQMLVVCLAP